MEEVNKDIVKKLRVNEEIRTKEVRLVGEKGEQLGIMPLYQALETARKQNIDLVEIAPTAVPPVCRFLDYGKYKYQQAKKERELKRNQKVSVLREVRLRPKIGIHDFESKARTAKKLLEDGDKVKVTVIFRGREIIHPEQGWKLHEKMVESLQGVALIERQPLMEGRRMIMVMTPATGQQSKTKEEIKEA